MSPTSAGGAGIDAIIAGIEKRLAELGPLREEFERLKAAQAVLNGAPVAPAARSSARVSAGRPARGGGRAPRGANRSAILAFVGANPGASVAQIAEATGIPRPTLHSTVYGLKRSGILVARGDGVAVGAEAPGDGAVEPSAGAARRPRARRARGRRAAARRAARRRSR